MHKIICKQDENVVLIDKKERCYVTLVGASVSEG